MRQLQGNLPQACCRTPREVDEADDVHSCFFSKGVFRDALNKDRCIAKVRNAGITVADGDIIVTIDSDNLMTKGTLEIESSLGVGTTVVITIPK